MNKEKMKNEAIKRMKIMQIMPEIIEEFEKNDVVEVSERQNSVFNAILYYTSSYPGLEEEIKKFEKEYGGLVYHIQLTYTEFGKLFSFFYVSKYEEEWEDDVEALKNNESLVYVYNMSDPFCSEFGSIGFRPSLGGVERVW